MPEPSAVEGDDVLMFYVEFCDGIVATSRRHTTESLWGNWEGAMPLSAVFLFTPPLYLV